MKPDARPIAESLAVGVDPALAFEVFTVGMGTWWPVDSYSRAVSELAHEHVEVVRLEFQPRLGGAIIEHLSDGRQLPWGEVIDWDPPQRVVIAWKPHALPEPPTELEVTFRAGPSGTLVELQHRGWDRVSPGFLSEMYGLYERGWPGTLGRFVDVAEATSPGRSTP
jgi:uncharacterized protein YndB with AHSA1/START domain